MNKFYCGGGCSPGGCSPGGGGSFCGGGAFSPFGDIINELPKTYLSLL